MNIKDVKIGETYLLPVTVTAIENGGWIETRTCNNYSYRHAPSEVNTLLPNSTKNTETAPQYDPCRKFRKWDMVRVVEWNGRDIARVGEIGHVVSDEYNSRVEIAIDGWTKEVYYPACHLKLVTPAEELEPYFIEEISNGYKLMKRNGKQLANYWEDHPQAKAAAEAECARLNAEYRQSTINNKQS